MCCSPDHVMLVTPRVSQNMSSSGPSRAHSSMPSCSTRTMQAASSQTCVSGASWLAEALSSWEIEVLIVDLDDAVRDGLRDAQARQVMMNPPLGV